jgi:hypothetical protein
MSATKPVSVRKNFRLDPAKIASVQKVLHAATETEAINRALDQVITEAERDRTVLAAHQQFLKSGIVIQNVLDSTVE